MEASPNPFSELGLSPQILAAVNALGFRTPSAIQAAAIPLVLEGLDLVGLSQTGSGKTAAFSLPALQKIRLSEYSTQALILCPTRELSIQVCEQILLLGANQGGLSVVPIYGGAPLDRQSRLLQKGAHIVTATPGRLLDHVRRGSIDLSNVRMVILDEADRMLDMGFRDEVEAVLGALPEERQTLFFSATMSPGVDALIRRFGRSPKTIKIQQDAATVQGVDQRSYVMRESSKVEVLCRILEIDSPRLALVFCNTKRTADDCTESLLARGYQVDRLHGDISQIQRERTLNRFREGVIDVLVATDVAARGIDIDEVDAVFNFDIPFEPEDYVHRIGRTARAGRTGKAHTFVAGRGFGKIRQIEQYTGCRIVETPLPGREAVEAKRMDLIRDAVRENLALPDQPTYQAHLESLVSEGHSLEEIANALFGLVRVAACRETQEIPEDRSRKSERPTRSGAEPSPKEESRTERTPREVHPPRPEKSGAFTELFLNIGRASGAQPGDIAGMIYSEAQLPKGTLGRIQLLHKHSLVDVKTEFAQKVIDSTREATLKGIRVRLDYPRFQEAPRPKPRGQQRPRESRGSRKHRD
ncbi:MAG: ATP-dependent RNA helicase DeaD [Verrucomicrobia bacterium]|nr:MAG: ATP-dependent RNA helicase DeaD [Verrucomicrobiota bacterium]